MQFLPTQLYPNNIALIPSVANTFSWQVNGDFQVAYQLKIYKNSDSSLVYDSTKVTSSTAKHVLLANTLTTNIDYKWNVRIYKDATNYIDSQYVFIKCLSAPIITMTVPSSMTTQFYTFSASYSQVENIPFDKWKMILYDSTGTIIIQDTGWNYNYNITYTFDGFEPDASYQIECITEYSAYALSATTGKQSFTVTYDYPANVNYFNANVLDEIGGIKLLWQNLIQIIGESTGTISYVDGKFGQGAEISSDGTIKFNVTVPETFTHTYYVKLPSDFTGDMLGFGDELFVGFDNNISKFYIRYYSNYVYGEVILLPTGYFLIGVTPNKVIIADKKDVTPITVTRNSVVPNPLELYNPTNLTTYNANALVTIDQGEIYEKPSNVEEWFEILGSNIYDYKKVVDIISY